MRDVKSGALPSLPRFAAFIVVPSIALFTATCVPAQTSAFRVEDCLRKNFPLALGIPKAPVEVRFYCAAPWNLSAFESVRTALDRANYNVVEATVRMASPMQRPFVKHALPFALDAAKSGPASMQAVWYVYHLLPLLYDLHQDTPEARDIAKTMDAGDLKALRAAAAAIDWKQSALMPGLTLEPNTPLKPDARLSEVSDLILRLQ